LTSLQSLNLFSTGVTGAGLKDLAGLKNLQTLELRFTKVSDKEIEALAELTGLQSLDIRDTKVTRAGGEELRKALPGCEIDH
jgi:hypothetical protein